MENVFKLVWVCKNIRIKISYRIVGKIKSNKNDVLIYI